MRTIRYPDLAVIFALLVVLAIPFLFRPARPATRATALPLVIISPHNEAVQYEFAQAFRQWHLKNFGQDVAFDWRNIGGTSEIVRFLDDAFQAAGRAGVGGIGLDLFFGGGQYDHARQAGKGQTVPCGLRERHPEWLREEILPLNFSGETFYDPGDRWYGCCLSSFGICYNADFFEAPPRQWQDLADFRLFKRIALADPTKSGSSNKAFEMLIQQQMAEELAARGKTAENALLPDLAAGWRRALNLIRQIGANARYFTDSASKVTADVAQGNAAAGMCIDFYGRFESETVARNENSTRMQYRMPEGGSSISVDPISLLRGAPHAETAQRFIDFCLSVEGQMLWNTRVGRPCDALGRPGGPQRYALRRLPVRRDLYRPEYLANMSDPLARPYQQGAGLQYQAKWTAPLFNVIHGLVRAMCLDAQTELQEAWAAIHQAEPAQRAAALNVFSALPPDAEYAPALAQTARAITNKLAEAEIMRAWTVFFRKQYRKAAEIADLEP